MRLLNSVILSQVQPLFGVFRALKPRMQFVELPPVLRTIRVVRIERRPRFQLGHLQASKGMAKGRSSCPEMSFRREDAPGGTHLHNSNAPAVGREVGWPPRSTMSVGSIEEKLVINLR